MDVDYWCRFKDTSRAFICVIYIGCSKLKWPTDSIFVTFAVQSKISWTNPGF